MSSTAALSMLVRSRGCVHEILPRYEIDYWDASILAAAEQARCSRLLTEDLNPGQLYATLRIENPLAS